jgi:hypothetical protein
MIVEERKEARLPCAVAFVCPKLCACARLKFAFVRAYVYNACVCVHVCKCCVCVNLCCVLL